MALVVSILFYPRSQPERLQVLQVQGRHPRLQERLVLKVNRVMLEQQVKQAGITAAKTIIMSRPKQQ